MTARRLALAPAEQLHSAPDAAVPAAAAPADLLGYPEAARRLGIPVGTLRSLVSRKQIPHVRLTARIVRLDPADLDAWIAARRVPAGGRP